MTDDKFNSECTNKCRLPWTSLLAPVLDGYFDGLWTTLKVTPDFQPYPHLTLLRRIPVDIATQRWQQVTTICASHKLFLAHLSNIRLIRRHAYDVLLVDVTCSDIMPSFQKLRELFPEATAEPFHITLGYFAAGTLKEIPESVKSYFCGRHVYLGSFRSYQITAPFLKTPPCSHEPPQSMVEVAAS